MEDTDWVKERKSAKKNQSVDMKSLDHLPSRGSLGSIVILNDEDFEQARKEAETAERQKEQQERAAAALV